ncbi:MAG: right-handed parallel beta-helix repeat-containing protein, partial [Pseudomonadales bacterium]|nr:right-handed parallel beta-helix repeat-containing protein [Pseudomonadales bacterium]
MNGSMLNPSPSGSNMQGYDSTMYGGRGLYSDSLNVASGLSSSNPLTLGGGNSLVSSISYSASGNLPQTITSAILTVVNSPPPAGSFRPAYCNVSKAIKFNKNQLDYSILAKLSPVSGTPSLASVERYFERPWIDHANGWLGRYMHPAENMPDYGREISLNAGTGSLVLNLNFSDAQKEKLLIRYVQLGIDLFGIVQDGGTNCWEPDGGHASGRKWPILFAGLVMGDGDMMNIGRAGISGYGPGHPDYVHFGEDDQTFYVSQTDVSSGRYSSSDIGLPEWGIRHVTYPNMDNKSWSADYRQCCTANSWAGAVLSARIMGVRNLWNHDALFDYQDRYMNIESGWERQMSTFAANMWDAYRADYGGIWPDTTPPETDNTPPLAPTGLTSTNIGSTSIGLSWTASQKASDGDLASGYRIYRDDVSVATVNSTTYTDSGLTPETEYIYSVFSYDNANNQSQTAAEAIFTTIAGNGGPVIPPPSGDAFYISPNGNNSNSGTSWSQALRNLPSTLQRGAVYYFAGGTYPDYTFDDPASGSAYISIKKATLSDHGVETGWTSAYANDQAVFGEFSFSGASHVFFDGISPDQTAIRWNNSSASGGSVVSFSNSNNITLLNCDIDGYYQGSSSNQTNGSCNCVGIQDSSYITIDGCLIHDGADDGLEIFSCSNLDISHNEVYDLHGCGTDGGCGPCYNGHSDGFEVFNVSDSQFVGNFVHDIPSTSTFFFGGWASSSAEYCRNILFANNIFYNNLNTGFIAYIQFADSITLYNNTYWGMVGGAYGGLSIGTNVTNLEMYNNIILSINYSHMGASYNASQHRGDHNFFGVSLGQYQEQANDIVGTDPGFAGVNGANGPLISNISRDDFMLKNSSPCVDSGTNVDLEFDIAGNPRPIGNGFDIGAFEYGVATADTTPPQVSSITLGESYVEIKFNEAVENVSATDVANYNINNNITISSAALNQQNNTVTLATTAHNSTTDYQITINNVKDLAGNVMAEVVFDYKFVQDIVGNWQFNEPDGTSSEDLSPFGNTAALINGALLNGAGQVVFDGIDDAVEVSMENMQASSGTIAVKVQQADPAGSQYIFGHTIGTWSNRLQIYLNNGNLSIGLGDSHSTDVNIEQFVPGNWYLVALTWNGSEYNVYVDGVLKTTGSYSGLDSMNTSADFGNDGNPALRDEALNGSIDEAMIYNYVLSTEQIAKLSGPVDINNYLVGHWNFIESAGNTAADLSEYNNSAALINGATFSGTGDVILDGVDDAIEMSMGNMQVNSGTIAINAMQEDPAGSQYLFGHTIGTWSDRIQIYLDNGSLSIGLGDSHTTNVNIEQFVAGQWYLVALTWNGSEYNVYVDGTLKASGSYSGFNAIGATADIGNTGNPDYRDQAFNGLIGEARIYSYTLKAEDIAKLSGKGDEDTSLVGHWIFNEITGDTATDSSGYSNSATLINGTAFTGEGAVIFDGIDDAVEVSMENMRTSAGTITLRVTPTSYAGDVSLSNYLFGHSGADWN